MRYPVTPTMLAVLQSPAAQAFARLVNDERDNVVEEVLYSIAMGNFADNNGNTWLSFSVAIGGHMHLPFTAESQPGMRVHTLWEQVRNKHPNNAQVQEFRWVFFSPDKAARIAAFVAANCGEGPVYFEPAA